jgi:hypothetical protein
VSNSVKQCQTSSNIVKQCQTVSNSVTHRQTSSNSVNLICLNCQTANSKQQTNSKQSFKQWSNIVLIGAMCVQRYNKEKTFKLSKLIFTRVLCTKIQRGFNVQLRVLDYQLPRAPGTECVNCQLSNKCQKSIKRTTSNPNLDFPFDCVFTKQLHHCFHFVTP